MSKHCFMRQPTPESTSYFFYITKFVTYNQPKKQNCDNHKIKIPSFHHTPCRRNLVLSTDTQPPHKMDTYPTSSPSKRMG